MLKQTKKQKGITLIALSHYNNRATNISSSNN